MAGKAEVARVGAAAAGVEVVDAVGAFLLLATLAAIAMAPLWLADVLPYDEWLDRLFGIQSWI